jgi:hypothetical protein
MVPTGMSDICLSISILHSARGDSHSGRQTRSSHHPAQVSTSGSGGFFVEMVRPASHRRFTPGE